MSVSSDFTIATHTAGALGQHSPPHAATVASAIAAAAAAMAPAAAVAAAGHVNRRPPSSSWSPSPPPRRLPVTTVTTPRTLIGANPAVRWRFEQVGNERAEREALRLALQESRDTLREEARRAGAAEALLRERTATLEAVTRREMQREVPRLGALTLSTSEDVKNSQETQLELQHVLADRERLLETLANVELSTISLHQQVDAAGQEAERLKVEADAQERRRSELSQDLQQALTERDLFAIAASRDAEALQHQRTEMALMSNKADALREELREARDQLEKERMRASQAQEEKRNLEVTFHSYKEHLGTGSQQQLGAIAALELSVDKLSRQVRSAETELGAQQGSLSELQHLSYDLQRRLADAELERIEMHNTIQELKGNIRVFCRVRPAPEGEECALETQDPDKISLYHGGDCHTFTFDKIFGPATTQAEVFEEVAGMVQSALDGYKVSIFAYGQTGSGKTYTMQGAEDGPDSQGVATGLIPRALNKIFRDTEEMRGRGWSWSIRVSVMEVYNEVLRDLLRGTGDAAAGPARGEVAGGGPVHTIAQHESWGTVVTGMTCTEVENAEQIGALLARAARQRAVGATDANAVSSRSHCVFALYVKGTNTMLNKEVHGALHLVDLAGSERLDRSCATGDRLKETRNINRSLSSLVDVFTAKAEGRAHVPFRNSRLTHLMEPCLSGHGKTLMLVNVQAERSNAHETLCSLRFARQVSQCNTGGKPRRSVKMLPFTPAPFAPPSREPSKNKLDRRLPSASQERRAPSKLRCSEEANRLTTDRRKGAGQLQAARFELVERGRSRQPGRRSASPSAGPHGSVPPASARREAT